MIERMEETARQLKLKDIESLESTIGMVLPYDYRAFLLKFNGGRPVPNGFPIEGLANNPFGVIQVFFGVDDPIESCNIIWNRNIFCGRMPDSFLPIACTETGDIICLSLYGNDAGTIAFWDHEAEHESPTYDNVYRLASNFSDFIASIYEWPNPYAMPDQ